MSEAKYTSFHPSTISSYASSGILECLSSTEVPCACGCNLIVTIEGASSSSPKYHCCTIFLPGSNSRFLPVILSSHNENSEPDSVDITAGSPVHNCMVAGFVKAI